MIRDLYPDDRNVFLSVVKDFYSSDAMAHSAGPQHFKATSAAVTEKFLFLRALMVEEEGKPAEYALLSFTCSNEAGGLVVLIEEVHLSEVCRGMGYGHQFSKFLEQEYPSAECFRPEVREQNENAIRLYQRLGYKILDYLQMVKDA